MSFDPNDPGRPCCSGFSQPVSDENRQAAVDLQNRIDNINSARGFNIVYRPSANNYDVQRPLIRWSRTPYQEVYVNGFLQATQQDCTPDEVYYDLDHYVHEAGAPLDDDRPYQHVFTSTTLNDQWIPNPTLATLPRGEAIHYYRYEIYAPGGIWVAPTLGVHYEPNEQDEVCFPGGIAPQYIRSCIEYLVTRDPQGRYVSIQMTDPAQIIVNANFNPQTHPPELLDCYLPTYEYIDDELVTRTLPEVTYPPAERRQKREISNENQDTTLEWYTHEVVEVPSYITGAFRSARENEAYFFLKDKYVLMNYAPGTTDDKVLNGPIRVRDGFPSLKDTPFGEQGISCAFATDYESGFIFHSTKSEAYIFTGNLCAYIDYAPGTTDDKIISGPKAIVDMFPFFKSMVFENRIDAAFNGPNSHEVYLFSGDKYALINYDSKELIHFQTITEGFPSLQGTIFARDIEAAFASHKSNEAYLFKGEFYAPINFAPGTTDDYIIGGNIKKIIPNFPSLSEILPLKNKGVVYQVHQTHEVEHQPHVHDEL